LVQRIFEKMTIFLVDPLAKAAAKTSAIGNAQKRRRRRKR
jgi:hypothetical protein